MKSLSHIFAIGGFLVVVVPLLGIPLAWKQWLLVVVGICLIISGWMLSRESSTTKTDTADIFAEDKPDANL